MRSLSQTENLECLALMILTAYDASASKYYVLNPKQRIELNRSSFDVSQGLEAFDL
jgi:hypothetical protein